MARKKLTRKQPGDRSSATEPKAAAKKTSKSAKTAKTTSKKVAKASAKKVAKKAGAANRNAAAKTRASKTLASKTPASKTARKSAKTSAGRSKSTVSKSTVSKSTVSKSTVSKTTAKKLAVKRAAKRPATTIAPGAVPAPRRATSRISASRRAAARKHESHESLVKKTLSEPGLRAPAAKAASKRAARKRAAKKTSAAARSARKAGRTSLTRRTAKKTASPALRSGARTRVTKETAVRPANRPTGRRAPFRLHAIGVRDAHTTDWPAVERLLTDAFGTDAEARLVAALRKARDIVAALVAEYQGEIIGHIALSRLETTIDGRAVKAVALAPLAVAPTLQRRGVGSSLVAAGIEAARGAGYAAVFVLGDPTWYARFGFSAESARAFASPWSGATFLALALEPDSLAGESGEVKYPLPFHA